MRGCFGGFGEACANWARLDVGGPGGNPTMAKQNFQTGCIRQSKVACAAMKVLYDVNQPVIPDVAKMQAWRRSCDGGNTRDCATHGLMTGASGNKSMGLMDLERACMRQDGFACAIVKKIK